MNKRMGGLAFAVLAMTAAQAADAAPPAWTVGPGYTVVVSLSPRAAARLANPRDTVIVSADYYGQGNPKGRKLQDEMGQISLSPSRQVELAGAGMALFPGPRYDKNLLADIDQDGFQVLINVFSGRHSSPDNVLDCSFFQDKLAVAAKAPIQVSCKLIGE